MLLTVQEELEALGQSSAGMALEIGKALSSLTRSDKDCAEAITLIARALARAQETEFRCHGLALAIRQFALLPPNASSTVHRDIWHSAGLADAAEAECGPRCPVQASIWMPWIAVWREQHSPSRLRRQQTVVHAASHNFPL
jgi:hypothetical protein